jgi:hypothetical protein
MNDDKMWAMVSDCDASCDDRLRGENNRYLGRKQQIFTVIHPESQNFRIEKMLSFSKPEKRKQASDRASDAGRIC